jgi:predicted small secreted protein
MMRKIALLALAVLLAGCKTNRELSGDIGIKGDVGINKVVEVRLLPPVLDDPYIPPSPSAVPITDEIFAKVEFNNYQVNDFQYFLSENITLRREYTLPNNKVADDGQAILRSQPVRVTKEFLKSTPGILLRPDKTIAGKSLLDWHKEDGKLLVFFENDNQNYLTFVKSSKGEGKYRLLYENELNKTVKYGGVSYHVTFDGSEIPYLLIDLDEQTLPMIKNKTIISGRKLP